jgi:sugar phosphate isomerase/epimerase
MRLGVFTALYQRLPLDDTLDRLAALGVEAVELGTGNYPGAHHCDPVELLADPGAIAKLKKAVTDRGMIISALSQHGNPLHPDPDTAARAHETWLRTAELAELLEVPVVNGFSGCPGDHPGAKWPNWVTCAWPSDYLRILEWQWDEVAIPYWSEQAELAQKRGVRVAIELHPGFLVYHVESMLRLRAAAGKQIGANLDPSHLFWQGMDPLHAIKALAAEGALFHFHAKDTYIDPVNVARTGVLDTKPYGEVLDRSWTFRTVGYGHATKVWRDIVSTLRAVGYDYVISIEHEDPLLSIDEGLTKAVQELRPLMFGEKESEMFWTEEQDG